MHRAIITAVIKHGWRAVIRGAPISRRSIRQQVLQQIITGAFQVIQVTKITKFLVYLHELTRPAQQIFFSIICNVIILCEAVARWMSWGEGGSKLEIWPTKIKQAKASTRPDRFGFYLKLQATNRAAVKVDAGTCQGLLAFSHY